MDPDEPSTPTTIPALGARPLRVVAAWVDRRCASSLTPTMLRPEADTTEVT